MCEFVNWLASGPPMAVSGPHKNGPDDEDRLTMVNACRGFYLVEKARISVDNRQDDFWRRW